MIPPPFGIVTALRPVIEVSPIVVGATIFSVIAVWFTSFAAVARALVPHPGRPVRHLPSERVVVP
jgi:hypothetical protein